MQFIFIIYFNFNFFQLFLEKMKNRHVYFFSDFFGHKRDIVKSRAYSPSPLSYVLKSDEVGDFAAARRLRDVCYSNPNTTTSVQCLK